VLLYHHFEPSLSFTSWSLYHCNYSHYNQLRYFAATCIFSFHRLKSIFIVLAFDLACNPGPIKIEFCNICSIHNKSAQVFDYIISKVPDIFGLSETHLSKDESASFIQDLLVICCFIYLDLTILVVVLGALLSHHKLVLLYQHQTFQKLKLYYFSYGF
jgi:hypothetical protein